MSDFRYREDVGFERRCPMCLDWWPVDLDSWDKRWSTKCRACIKSWKRDYQNGRYQTDVEYREDRKAAARLTSWKERVNEPERLAARRRTYDIATADRRRERQRINYWANRDHILARRRAKRAA